MGDVQVKASSYRSQLPQTGKTGSRTRLLLAALACAPLAACDALPALPTLSTGSNNPIFAGGTTLTHGYVFDDKVLDEIKPGTDVQNVLQKLGQPSNVSTVGNQTFYYTSQTTYQRFMFQKPSVIDQRVFAIYFDKTFKVERLANWGMQDGKVFDFISRATPSSGAEQSFLRQIFNGSTKLSPFAL
ncbi:Outer membrane protein assembly factor BamE, lipoprotein component of the BamABCDE complex [Rhizobiales bacterium GAS188]|nr:Outer membrane protein assembly factor BamE, lipoprotein component of the BamABCDE complex [Rhizobiales bacterium GAS188]